MASPRGQTGDTEAEPIRVLCLASVPHSGSTILGNLLGQLDGFMTIGELFYLSVGLEHSNPCGCGRQLVDCPVWQQVFAEAFGTENPLEQVRPDRYYVALRQLPRLLARPQSAEHFRDVWSRLFSAVAETTGARVIVDTSKSPSYFEIVRRCDRVEPYMLHLVRHPVATARSWAKIEGITSPPWVHGLIWDGWNVAIEARWASRRGRYLRVRYEDFATSPADTLLAIADFVGEQPAALPVTSDGTAQLGVTHTVAGNDSRFVQGDVPIRLDDEWRRAMPAAQSKVIAATTWPLRRRYGYA